MTGYLNFIALALSVFYIFKASLWDKKHEEIVESLLWAIVMRGAGNYEV